MFGVEQHRTEILRAEESSRSPVDARRERCAALPWAQAGSQRALEQARCGVVLPHDEDSLKSLCRLYPRRSFKTHLGKSFSILVGTCNGLFSAGGWPGHLLRSPPSCIIP